MDAPIRKRRPGKTAGRTCEEDGCAKPMRSRGLCSAHYALELREEGISRGIPCLFDRCRNVATMGKYCDAHRKQKSQGIELKPFTPRRKSDEVKYRDDAGRKYCVGCAEWLPESNFFLDGRAIDGVRARCMACAAAQMREKKWGISPERWPILWERQNGCCAVCRKPLEGAGARNAYVDHDHSCCPSRDRSCGECIRGILHGTCNSLLGLAYDDPDILRGGAEYLERWASR